MFLDILYGCHLLEIKYRVHPHYTATFWTKLYFGDEQYLEGEISIQTS
jgi:hypothetical protein